jgi:hypothetical protein
MMSVIRLIPPSPFLLVLLIAILLLLSTRKQKDCIGKQHPYFLFTFSFYSLHLRFLPSLFPILLSSLFSNSYPPPPTRSPLYSLFYPLQFSLVVSSLHSLIRFLFIPHLSLSLFPFIFPPFIFPSFPFSSLLFFSLKPLMANLKEDINSAFF